LFPHTGIVAFWANSQEGMMTSIDQRKMAEGSDEGFAPPGTIEAFVESFRRI
jgi:hypothetical protein